MLLVAAAGKAERIVDLGAGVGTVALALLVLERASHAVLLERDPDYAALARQNIVANRLDGRALVVEADVDARASILSELGLAPGLADVVVANPPFNTPGRHRASPDEARAAAHQMTPESFETWTRTAARALKPGGRFVLIHRPDALVWLLPLLSKRFGALNLRAVHPKPDDAARRILISARLNSKAPARVLPALVLHHQDGSFTEQAAAIHAGDIRLTCD